MHSFCFVYQGSLLLVCIILLAITNLQSKIMVEQNLVTMHTFVIPMADGNDLLTVLVSVKNDTDLSFNRLFGDAADDKVVGFDTEYSLEPKFSRDLNAHVIEKRIALVKLCTKCRCILFRLDKDNIDYVHLLKTLSALLANKDIVFVGVRKRDVFQGSWLLVCIILAITNLKSKIMGEQDLATMHTFVIHMADGNDLSTVLVSVKNDTDLSFNRLFGDAADDKVVGFDTEYSLEPKFSRDLNAHVIEKRIALVKLCTKCRCILFRLDKDNIDYVHLLKKLSALLANRDIVFVGVRKRDDLAKLRNDYGLEISNFVELSELVVSVLGKPVLGTYGARELASYLKVLRNFEPRNSTLSLINWLDNSLNREQIMCAVTDTYAAYKIGKKLLEDRSWKWLH